MIFLLVLFLEWEKMPTLWDFKYVFISNKHTPVSVSEAALGARKAKLQTKPMRSVVVSKRRTAKPTTVSVVKTSSASSSTLPN